MHELSIVMSIIGIAETESVKCQATAIEEIELEIGTLSGVEMAAFDFAWQQAVKSTLLEHAEKKVLHTTGLGICVDCNAEFEMETLYDPCPVCSGHFINIKRGKELRVKSMLVN